MRGSVFQKEVHHIYLTTVEVQFGIPVIWSTLSGYLDGNQHINLIQDFLEMDGLENSVRPSALVARIVVD